MSPTTSTIVTAIVTIIVAAAGSSALTAWIQLRGAKKQRDDEAPARRESLTVEGSAKAVLTMDQALTAANDRAAQAEQDVALLRSEVRTMKLEHRQEIDELRAEHDREIADVRARFKTELESMRAQIAEAYRTRPNANGGTP